MKSSRTFLIILMPLFAVALAGCGTQPAGSGGAGDAGATATSGPSATHAPTPAGEPNSGNTQTPIASHGGPAADYVSLVDTLRAAGVTVEPAGEIEQAFFSAVGQVIKVNGVDVQVFEYADEPQAAAEAATVFPDGGTIGTSMVTWIAPPHFYKAGRVIALYVGDDSAVIGALEKVLGPQFAGR